MLTGASRSVYASAQGSTVAIHDTFTRVPESAKELWVPQESRARRLSAKVGAWGAPVQEDISVLRRAFRYPSRTCEG
ncbi:hypothetical protein DL771_005857 [Monosporascus sp. 5C6A]|nr:hypothetical protein DL771_005857 [Monosporascus sp. 5C6A]